MGCLAAIVAVLVPRIFLIFVFLLTDWFTRAYDTVVWPLLGFLFLPYTTIAYMAAMLNNDHRLEGLWIALVVVAVIVDLGSTKNTDRQRKRSRSKS